MAFVAIAAGLLNWGLGLIVGALMSMVTEYYTAMGKRPVNSIIQKSATGHATNIIGGLSVGMESTVIPILVLAAGIMTSYYFAGLYGVAIAAAGMMATTAMQLAIDAFGPIADNAGGIAEMSGMPKEVREKTDVLDAVCNTTAAIGKGFAIGSAALTALALTAARRGARVILAVRDVRKGERALRELRAGQPDADLELRRLDLADLDSVRAFAAGVRADGVRVDVLVNNAGVMMPPRSLSPQGQESQFAANHLGHFALTGLLLDLIDGPDPRVVTVSSGLYRRGRIHFDDLTGARSYSPMAFYAQSKFANVLFGLELDRRLRAAGRPLRSLLSHPGYTATNLQTSGPVGLAKTLGAIGNRLVAQSVAASQINAIVYIINYGESSSVYARPFSNPDAFDRLLVGVERRVARMEFKRQLPPVAR